MKWCRCSWDWHGRVAPGGRKRLALWPQAGGVIHFLSQKKGRQAENPVFLQKMGRVMKSWSCKVSLDVAVLLFSVLKHWLHLRGDTCDSPSGAIAGLNARLCRGSTAPPTAPQKYFWLQYQSLILFWVKLYPCVFLRKCYFSLCASYWLINL